MTDNWVIWAAVVILVVGLGGVYAGPYITGQAVLFGLNVVAMVAGSASVDAWTWAAVWVLAVFFLAFMVGVPVLIGVAVVGWVLKAAGALRRKEHD